MSALAPGLARRIDRLARHAHRFHRYAHHPLCGAYTGEVLALGRRTRVCRGCLYVGLGGGSGTMVGLVGRVDESLLLLAGVTGAVLGTVTLVVRLPKLWGRFVPAALAGIALGAGLRMFEARTLIALAAFAASAALGFALYRKRGPHRGPCASCPERLQSTPCSGLRPIVRRERAFQRLAQRWIDADG
jgi:hypothetical protein